MRRAFILLIALLLIMPVFAANPDSISYYEQGNSFLKQGKNAEAVQQYNLALSIDPTLSVAWYNKAIALDRLGRYSDALEAYHRTLALSPNDDTAWNNMGILLDKMGKYDEALDAYQHALLINPNNGEARMNIAFSFNKHGSNNFFQILVPILVLGGFVVIVALVIRKHIARMRAKPICHYCRNFYGVNTCRAYPKGIPEEILYHHFDHRTKFAGAPEREGLLFEIQPGTPLPAWWRRTK